VLTRVLGLTVLRGALEHDFNIEAMYNRNYSARMRARREKAEPRGRVMILEKQKDFDQAGINRLNAGIVSRSASSAAFSHALGKQPPKPKGQFERMARIARNDLMICSSSCSLSSNIGRSRTSGQKTQQPEAYLKEVLAEIGHLERSGPNNGTWRLQESYAIAQPEVKEDEMEVEGSQGIKMDPYKVEYPLEPSQNNSEFDYGEPDDEEDDEDDDEDEDDMEEVE
jgi:transcription initiation factor TFIIF subunit beta